MDHVHLHDHDPAPESRGRKERGNIVNDRDHIHPTTRGLNVVVNHIVIVDQDAIAVDPETIPLDLDHIRVTLERLQHRVMEEEEIAVIMAVPVRIGMAVVIEVVVVIGAAAALVAVDIEGEDVAVVMDREWVAGLATRESIRRPLECWAVSV